ncbi:MAG: PIN domain-containing protein [Thermoleophilia bacterium]|nr:PIN domain-containing protein [Thermoleophilia bacterium]
MAERRRTYASLPLRYAYHHGRDEAYVVEPPRRSRRGGAPSARHEGNDRHRAQSSRGGRPARAAAATRRRTVRRPERRGAPGAPTDTHLVELADTSAWTNSRKDDAVRRRFDDQVRNGEIATCPMVVLELLWETRDASALQRRRELLSALVELPIGAREWQRATDVFALFAAEGPLYHRRVKLPDLLVAAAAESAGVPVCHYDADFELIAGVTGQPVRAIAPLGSI